MQRERRLAAVLILAVLALSGCESLIDTLQVQAHYLGKPSEGKRP